MLVSSLVAMSMLFDCVDRRVIGSADSVLVGARVLRRSRRSDSTAATLWDDRGLGRSSEEEHDATVALYGY